MKKIFSHILPVIFLGFLLLPFAGSILLQSAQSYLKAKAMERMEKEDLVNLSVPLATIRWEEKGKEFWIDGKLFDVKTFTTTGSTITATGFFDEEETDIINTLFAWRKNNRQSFVSVFLLLQCFTAVILFLLMGTFNRCSTLIYSFFTSFLPLPHLLILIPPPKD